MGTPTFCPDLLAAPVHARMLALLLCELGADPLGADPPQSHPLDLVALLTSFPLLLTRGVYGGLFLYVRRLDGVEETDVGVLHALRPVTPHFQSQEVTDRTLDNLGALDWVLGLGPSQAGGQLGELLLAHRRLVRYRGKPAEQLEALALERTVHDLERGGDDGVLYTGGLLLDTG